MMTDLARRVKVSFGDVTKIDDDIKSFWISYPIPKDGVKILNLHLMHGMFQLLRTRQKVWPKLKEKSILIK